ncbi:MAG: hypothetical protein M3Z09_09565, partial [Acidobacteriota bacterium]|nr:hypothetical protein [Acidobacteriota bacterium]
MNCGFLKCGRTLLALGCLSSLGFGQIPVIPPGGIVNAASGVGAGPAFHALARGSLASIFGSNLARGVQAADSTPLPTSLQGASVTVNGVPAPLLYVSPTQINLEIPTFPLTVPVSSTQASSVIVTTAGGSSVPVNFSANVFGPGLFTANGSGCGQGAVQNVSASGEVSLNSAANSAEPGQFLVVYGTGFGGFFKDGLPAPALPLPVLDPVVLAVLDGTSLFTSYAGLAPGLVGVDQFNFQIPDPVREGCAIPLRIENYLAGSQPVTVAIHRGGGACVDPPSAADGIILLERVTTVGSAAPGTVETLDAVFTQSPGRTVTRLDPNNGRKNGYNPSLPDPDCPIAGYRQLSAGNLGVKTGSSMVGGITAAPGASYHATLPAGTLQAGTVTVSSDGSGTVGSFEAAIPFGQDI